MTTKKDSRKKSGRMKKVGGIVKGASQVVSGIGSILEAVGGNHPEWYEAYPLDNLIAINFGAREKVGKYIPWNSVNLRSPSDCAIPIALTIPTAKNKLAFVESHQILMNKLRAASGSNINYTIYDLMAYTLNAREILALYTLIRRTILCTRIVDPYDEDAPTKYALMSNSGWQLTTTDITTLTQNLASDTVRLNRLAPIISTLIPIRMSLMARTAWLFSNIFADGTTAKFSTKMFTLGKVYTYVNNNGIINPGYASQLSNMTLSAQLDVLERLLSNFTSAVENSRIAGDFMKAFGPFFTHIQGIDEGTRILPIYDEAALTQIQNMTVAIATDVANIIGSNGIPSVTTSFTTNANNDLGGSNYASLGVGIASFLAQYTAYAPDAIVNTYKDAVTPGEVISLSRLTSLMSYVPNSYSYDSGSAVGTFSCQFDACGTEVAGSPKYLESYSGTPKIYSFFPLCKSTGFNTTMGSILRVDTSIPNTIASTAEAANFWSMDDWAPRTVLRATPANNTYPLQGISDYQVMYDYSNWANLSLDYLMTYHEAATLSLLATPFNIREQSDFQFIR